MGNSAATHVATVILGGKVAPQGSDAMQCYKLPGVKVVTRWSEGADVVEILCFCVCLFNCKTSRVLSTEIMLCYRCKSCSAQQRAQLVCVQCVLCFLGHP